MTSDRSREGRPGAQPNRAMLEREREAQAGMLGRGGQAEETVEFRALAAHFDSLTLGFVADAQRSLDLARAQQDEDAAVREHIKMQVMRAARIMFQGSYHAVCGCKPLEISK